MYQFGSSNKHQKLHPIFRKHTQIVVKGAHYNRMHAWPRISTYYKAAPPSIRSSTSRAPKRVDDTNIFLFHCNPMWVIQTLGISFRLPRCQPLIQLMCSTKRALQPAGTQSIGTQSDTHFYFSRRWTTKTTMVTDKVRLILIHPDRSLLYTASASRLRPNHGHGYA